MMTAPPVETSEDAFLGGRLRLRQPRSGHRAGHDAMLLAAATPARSGDRVVDFGAGVGAAGLAVAMRVGGIQIVLVERDETLAGLASRNAELNGIAAQVCILDVAGGAEVFASVGLGPDSADVVLMNPPFNDPARHRSSPDDIRRAAHMAEPAALEASNSCGAARAEIRRRAQSDLAQRRSCRGADRAWPRLGRRRDSARASRRGQTGDPHPGSRSQREPGAARTLPGSDA